MTPKMDSDMIKKKGLIVLVLLICLLTTACSIATKNLGNVSPSPTDFGEGDGKTSPSGVEPTMSAPTAKTPNTHGITYPPYPEGVTGGGLLIIDPLQDHKYGLSLVKANNQTWLWFDKYSDRNSEGQVIWSFLDSIELPPLQEKEVFIPQGCKLGQIEDPEIIVIALLDETAEVSRYVPNENIRFAWRANRAKEKFEMISLEEIECSADSAMYY